MIRARGKAFVLMATHNSSQWVEEALHSVLEVCGRVARECRLYVGDDGSNDDTFDLTRRTLRHVPTCASICRAFDKASTVAEAKNRVYAMARPNMGSEDWLLWMDDDDVMLDGRMRIVEAAENFGDLAVVGNYISMETGRRVVVPDEAIRSGEFAPALTAVRGCLLPPERYFEDVPDTMFEDLATHAMMTRRGVAWKHVPFDVLRYRRRFDGVVGRDVQFWQKREATLNWISTQPT